MISVVSRGFLKDGGGDGGGNATPPSIVVVSPTPGVAPGLPGGFPRSYHDAKDTAIVLRVTDIDPGLQYFAVIARFYGASEDPNPLEEVVYRRDRFRGPYVSGSSSADIADGLELTVRRRGGWPENDKGHIAHIVFAVDALDADGNLSP